MDPSGGTDAEGVESTLAAARADAPAAPLTAGQSAVAALLQSTESRRRMMLQRGGSSAGGSELGRRVAASMSGAAGPVPSGSGRHADADSVVAEVLSRGSARNREMGGGGGVSGVAGAVPPRHPLPRRGASMRAGTLLSLDAVAEDANVAHSARGSGSGQGRRSPDADDASTGSGLGVFAPPRPTVGRDRFASAEGVEAVGRVSDDGHPELRALRPRASIRRAGPGQLGLLPLPPGATPMGPGAADPGGAGALADAANFFGGGGVAERSVATARRQSVLRDRARLDELSAEDAARAAADEARVRATLRRQVRVAAACVIIQARWRGRVARRRFKEEVTRRDLASRRAAAEAALDERMRREEEERAAREKRRKEAEYRAMIERGKAAGLGPRARAAAEKEEAALRASGAPVEPPDAAPPPPTPPGRPLPRKTGSLLQASAITR